LGWQKFLRNSGNFSLKALCFRLLISSFLRFHFQWGEGAGGGWFRLKLGEDILGVESSGCTWATPAQADVQRAMKQFEDSL
jgi:hypothetical protein